LRLLVAGLVASCFVACNENSADRWYIEQGRTLVLLGANREVVIEKLGDDMFLKGDDLRKLALQFVRSKNKRQIDDLLSVNPCASFYSTPNITVFILYDTNGKAVEMLTGPQ
jgi:hypothetical protein